MREGAYEVDYEDPAEEVGEAKASEDPKRRADDLHDGSRIDRLRARDPDQMRDSKVDQEVHYVVDQYEDERRNPDQCDLVEVLRITSLA